MTQDAIEFIRWLFDAGWSLLKSTPHPAWNNLSLSDFFLGIFAIRVAFTLLNMVFGVAPELDQRDQYFSERLYWLERSRKSVKVSKARANDEK